MLFSSRLSTSSIILLCRALRHNLDAGIMLRDTFRQQARRGPADLRPVAERMCEAIESGDSLKAALNREKKHFPPLFLALAGVGEKTGNLPEIFGALEKYYAMQQRFWRQFISQSTLPIVQFVAAMFVIAFTLFVLGWIAEATQQKAMDPIGLGTGASGAITFLCLSFGTVAALIIGYVVLSRSLEQKAVVDGLLLRIPGLGPFLRALAMARLTMALRLTLDSAAPITQALDLSLKATGNAFFATAAPGVKESLRSGDDLTVALTRTGLFPDDFLNVVAVGEESGRLPEAMAKQGEFYEEEAERRLAVLTKLAGFGVWAVVATIIVIAIFRFALIYLNAINQAAGGMF